MLPEEAIRRLWLAGTRVRWASCHWRSCQSCSHAVETVDAHERNILTRLSIETISRGRRTGGLCLFMGEGTDVTR